MQFLRTGLLDDRALSSHLCKLIPASVPSGLPVLTFEGCPTRSSPSRQIVPLGLSL